MSKSQKILLGSVDATVLHEALTRAARVVATKGAGKDKAAGINFFFTEDQLHIQATDLDRTFYQRMDAEVEPSESVSQFRLSLAVQKFVAGLPLSTGTNRIRFLYDPAVDRIVVQFNKKPTKILIPKIVGEYPTIKWYEYADMREASELSSKLSAVAWAVDPSAGGVLSGVRFDGEWVEAMSSRQCARIKCDVDAEEPVCALLKSLAPVIKTGPKVRFLTLTDPGKVIVALDEFAQVSTPAVLGAWPNLTERLEALVLPQAFTVPKQRLLDALARVTAFTQGVRIPRMYLHVRQERLDLSLVDLHDGDVQDAIALSGRTGDGEATFLFNPVWLTEAIDSFPGSVVKVQFDDWTKPLKLSEPMLSYEAVMMGLKPDEVLSSEGTEE